VVSSLDIGCWQTKWVTVSPPRSLAWPTSAVAAVVGGQLSSFKPRPRWNIGSLQSVGKSVETGAGAIMTYHWILRAGSLVWISCGSFGAWPSTAGHIFDPEAFATQQRYAHETRPHVSSRKVTSACSLLRAGHGCHGKSSPLTRLPVRAHVCVFSAEVGT
jgi:hypothetical protein